MQLSKKVVILGHFGVGKTSLIRRFVDDTFSEEYKVSIGVHISKKMVEVSPTDAVSLILWDLEGTDEIETIRKAYLLGSHSVIFVFDVTRPSTFQNISEDLDKVKEMIGDIPLLVVGNKTDLVVVNELNTLLQQNNIQADYLTSAKTGGAVNELFLYLAKALTSYA